MTEPTATSIGAALRARRLELDISFAEVVTRTRIRQSYLEALEEETFEVFPGEAYLKGYLKGYAECLGLDPQPLLQALAAKTLGTEHRTPLEASPPPPLGGGATRPPIRLRGAVLLLGIIALLVLGWLLLGQTSSQPQPELAVQPAGNEKQGNLAPLAADLVANPVENRQPPTTEISPLPAESAAVADGLKADASTTVVSTPAAPPAPEASTAASVPAKEDPVVASNDKGVLRLQASGPGQLELTIDGRPAQRYTLQANTILSWKVARTARVYLENPGSARLWLGGQEVDLAGRNQIVLQSAEEPSR